MDPDTGAGNQVLYPAAGNVKQPRTSSLVLAVQFVVGVVVGSVLIRYVDRAADGLGGPVVFGVLAALVPAMWLQLLVHEAGHALAGVLGGRRFVGAGVGPLRLERGSGTWMLRWGGGIKGIGGFAATFPTRPETRGAAAVYLLGGPLANLAAAALAGLMLSILEPPSVLAMVVLGSLVVAGTLLGVVNLLPFQSKGWNSDGYALLQLLRNGAAWRVIQAIQLALAAAVAGVRPRDWPLGSLDVALGLPIQLQLPAHCLRMSVVLDRDDMAAARDTAAELAALWPDSPDGQRQGVALMLASYAARAGDAALLAAWRPHCEGGLLDLSPYRLWLDAEAAAMTGDDGVARARLIEARQALPRVHDRSSVDVLRGYLDELEGRLAQRQEAVDNSRGAVRGPGIHPGSIA